MKRVCFYGPITGVVDRLTGFYDIWRRRATFYEVSAKRDFFSIGLMQKRIQGFHQLKPTCFDVAVSIVFNNIHKCQLQNLKSFFSLIVP